MVLRKLSNQSKAEADGLEVIDGPLPHRPRLSVSSTLQDEGSPELGVELHTMPEKNEMIVSVKPPLKPADNGIRHVPCDIVLTIDVSGSMMAVPPLPDADENSKEQSYLSVLDLTKHAARTIIETLNEKDRLGVVVFSTQAEVIYNLLYMTKANKKAVLKRVEELVPLAATNLWHGLKEGLRLLKEASPVAENTQALFLLTDGQPNCMCPNQGYIPKLRQVLEEQKCEEKPLPSIHTFGFSNAIRSGLLQAIAELGTGTFSFIPDIGMLGTVFVHAVANLYTTFATQATLKLVTDADTELSSDEGGLQLRENTDDTPGEFTLNIGNLQYGQSRDILVRYDGNIKDSQLVTAQVSYNFQSSTKTTTLTENLMAPSTSTLSPEASEYHRSRARVCAFLRDFFPTRNLSDYQAIEAASLRTRRSKLKALVQDIKACGYTDEQNVSLVQDLAGESPQGQAGLAISKEVYYNNWGKHYLLSLLNAHTHQICNSFKDPGPLQYGKDSPLFISCRNNLDECFDNLPAPKPTGNRARSGNHTPVAMSRYNRASNPCFAGHCMVRLPEGEANIPIRDLRAGMSVWTPRGSRVVRAVVETSVRDIMLCNIGSLSVTPWHPIQQQGGSWAFPDDISEEIIFFTGEIYSVLLAPSQDPDAHAIMVGDSVCVTLGHGVQTGDGDVRAHEFFGSYQQVEQSLAQLPTDFNGLLRCAGIRRHAVTGLACAFIGAQEEEIQQEAARSACPLAPPSKSVAVC